MVSWIFRIVLLSFCMMEQPSQAFTNIIKHHLRSIPNHLHSQTDDTDTPIPTYTKSESSTSGELTRRTALLQGVTLLTLNRYITPPHASANTIERTKINSPNIQLQHTKTPKVQIPKVGYSLYKTDPAVVAQSIRLALQTNVKHFDVASLYGTNPIVGKVLYDYCLNGLPNIDSKGILIDKDVEWDGGDVNKQKQQTRAFKKRRKDIFITHKLSNSQQDTSVSQVKQSIFNDLKSLQVDYLDLCMIHSPLTDRERRLSTYQALVEMKEKGLIRSIGVCNYGVNALGEIVNSGYPPPNVIQLQLSPFNQHCDILRWANAHGSIMACAAWSKLSSAQGPQEGWSIVGDIAKKNGLTKAQILILWALQHGYLCVPRSAASSKLERLAIIENSFDGIKNHSLTTEEMNILDSLDEDLKSGQLSVIDGWSSEDIISSKWDPTEYV